MRRTRNLLIDGGRRDFSVEERSILVVQLVLILDDAEMDLGALGEIDAILHDELAALDPSPKD